MALDRTEAQEHIGLTAVAIMDALSADETIIALGELTRAVDKAARALEDAGIDPTQAAVLVTGLCLRSWRMETRDDG